MFAASRSTEPIRFSVMDRSIPSRSAPIHGSSALIVGGDA